MATIPGPNPDQILKILEKVDDWDFDVFALTEATNRAPLPKFLV